MTPDKRVEDLVTRIITISNEKTAGYEMKIENAITQYHQDISTALMEAARGNKVTYVFDGFKWRDTDMEWNTVQFGYNQALDDVEDIIRTLLESKN